MTVRDRIRRAFAVCLSGPTCVGGAAAGVVAGLKLGEWLDEALGRPFGIPTGFIPLGQIPVSTMLLGLLACWVGAAWGTLRFVGGFRGAGPLAGLLGCSACLAVLCDRADWGSLTGYVLAVSALTSCAGTVCVVAWDAWRVPR
jgi:hypothetical protein